MIRIILENQGLEMSLGNVSNTSAVEWMKIAQYNSCEFEFYSGNLLGTIAWGIASQ